MERKNPFCEVDSPRTTEALVAAIGEAAYRFDYYKKETMLDVMFEVPSQENVKTVRITKEAVDGTAKPILETAFPAVPKPPR